MSENNNASETGTVGEPAVAGKVAEFAISEPVSPRPEPKPATRSGSAISLLLNILVLMAVAALGYGYWQQKRTLNSVTTQQTALADQVANSSGQFTSLQDSQQQIDTSLEQMGSGLQAIRQQLQQTVAQQDQNQQQAQQQLQTQLGESNSRIAGLATQLNSAIGELAATRQQVRRLGNRTSDNVLLSEAAAQVELAQQRLLAARDVQSATTLLVGSDDLLARVETLDATAARAVLAGDLTSLKALPEVNIDALYQQLGDVISQVNTMSVVAGAENPEFAVPQPTAAEPAASGWFDSALSVLGDYFIVTRRDVELTPLFTAEQQSLLRQIITLQLTSAQVALLNAEPAVYRSALNAASDGINKWLYSVDTSKTAVLATLGRLGETPILFDMPDISASLNAIRQLAATTPAPIAAEVMP